MKSDNLTFKPFPLSSITPEGWLLKQLKIQAAGLSGNLDTFWNDVKNSAWIGGKAEGWERMPYWLDGAIPLAWLINDEPLKKRITQYMDYILEHQNADGWLGPSVQESGMAADVWSQMLALKMLSVYYDASGDKRALETMEKGLQKLDRHIDTASLHNWGQLRWFESLIALYQIYEIEQKDWLVDLAVKLHAQGFNWKDFFARWPLTKPTESKRWNLAGHVVNNAMAIKAHGLWWRITGDQSDKDAVYDMINKLDKYHGSVTGIFTGDECIAGTSATQGTELCAVVEYMYSLEILMSIFGDPAFGDRLEKIAFNALPATFSPDMWSHQYLQQANQIECNYNEERYWTTNGPDSNMYGLEPNYGCCTANLSQGWPKFASHLWMQSQDNGIAAVAYAPSKLSTEISGTKVTVDLQTDYPFKNKLIFRITTDKPVKFPFYLRIPGWAEDAAAKINNEKQENAEHGKFFKIDRLWNNDTVELILPMKPVIIKRDNNASAVVRGPIVYSLKIQDQWKQVNQNIPGREFPHADYEVMPVSPWNYALILDKNAPEKQITFEEHEISDMIFSPDTAPITAKAKAFRLSEWKKEKGNSAPPPESPVKIIGEPEEITLIPYGCTNLRITEFPTTEPIK